MKRTYAKKLTKEHRQVCDDIASVVVNYLLAAKLIGEDAVVHRHLMYRDRAARQMGEFLNARFHCQVFPAVYSKAVYSHVAFRKLRVSICKMLVVGAHIVPPSYGFFEFEVCLPD